MTDFNELGIKAMQLQKWDEAITAFQHVLKESPKSSGTWYMLGQCHRFSDEIDRSIQALKNAISLNDKEAPFFLALGISYQLAEKYEDSLDALTEASRIDPDYSLAYNSAAITRRKMGDHKRALEIYDLSIQAHLRKFLRNYQNTETQEPYGFINLGGELTTGYIIKAAIEHAKMSGIDKILLPTEPLDVPKSYSGLLWVDEADEIVITLEKGSRYYTANFLTL
jgi:tetratricopeptide (TPR) repeat protein